MFGDAMPDGGLLRPVLATLDTIRAAKRIRNDLSVAGSTPISSVHFGDGLYPLSRVLRGDDYRNEWRFLQSLDQRSPWDGYPGSINPEDCQEVTLDGRAAIGMLWATQKRSAIISFAFLPRWGDSHVTAQYVEMRDDGCDLASVDVLIPNLSNPAHVAIHTELITNYGRVLSGSSLVYEGEGFSIRMFVNDHNPPHFHVTGADGAETIARCRIETLDILSGRIPSALRGTVIEWARGRRDEE